MTQFKPVQDCRIPDLKRMFRHYERRFDVLLKTGFAFLVRQPTLEPFPSSPHYDINFLSFQEFDDYRDADDAVHDLNGRELLGERYIQYILGQPFGRQFMNLISKIIY